MVNDFQIDDSTEMQVKNNEINNMYRHEKAKARLREYRLLAPSGRGGASSRNLRMSR